MIIIIIIITKSYAPSLYVTGIFPKVWFHVPMYKKWYFKKVDQVEMAVITPHYSLLLLIIIIILTPHSLQYEKVKIIKKYWVKKRNDDIQSTILLCTFGS